MVKTETQWYLSLLHTSTLCSKISNSAVTAKAGLRICLHLPGLAIFVAWRQNSSRGMDMMKLVNHRLGSCCPKSKIINSMVPLCPVSGFIACIEKHKILVVEWNIALDIYNRGEVIAQSFARFTALWKRGWRLAVDMYDGLALIFETNIFQFVGRHPMTLNTQFPVKICLNQQI